MTATSHWAILLSLSRRLSQTYFDQLPNRQTQNRATHLGIEVEDMTEIAKTINNWSMDAMLLIADMFDGAGYSADSLDADDRYWDVVSVPQCCRFATGQKRR